MSVSVSVSVCLSLSLSLSLYIYIYIYIYTSVAQNILSLIKILDLSGISDYCMELPCTEIKTEIWISFSSFIKRSNVLTKQNYSVMTPLSG